MKDKGKTWPEGSASASAQRILLRGLVSVVRPGSTWFVRSESGNGMYSIRREMSGWSCTCPSASTTRACKHVIACQLLVDELPEGPALRTRSRVTYGQDWSAYDLGQEKEMPLVQQLLSDLAGTVPEPPRLTDLGGRLPVLIHDQIFGTVLKVWSGRSGRRARAFYDASLERGYLAQRLGRMTVQRFLNRSESTQLLENLVTLSALPLAGLESGEAVAPDSTGVQTTCFGAWREVKHGERRERRWLKVHAMVGTRTHVVIRAVVGEENSGDAPQFAPLLHWTMEAGFTPASVVADRGYLSRENYHLATDLGLEAYIPFKSNSVARIRSKPSPTAWRRAFHLFQANREEFDRSYHRRSNVESVFSALKRKFGENIRSRNRVAQVNEVLAKIIAYNLTVVVHEMFENGIAPAFSKAEPT